MSFFFSSKRFFHFFLEHLYICYLQVFMQKMQKLFSSQNSWPLGPKGIFEQDLIDFPAPPSNDFSICFMDLLNMLYTSFVQKPRHCTPIKIIGKQDIGFFFFFLQHIFLFVFWATIYAIYKFSCKNTDIEFRKKFFASRTSWHFRTKFNKICFSYERFFQLFLGPLNMLSKSFSAKMPKLCSGQNSWPVGPRGIMEQI